MNLHKDKRQLACSLNLQQGFKNLSSESSKIKQICAFNLILHNQEIVLFKFIINSRNDFLHVNKMIHQWIGAEFDR